MPLNYEYSLCYCMAMALKFWQRANVCLVAAIDEAEEVSSIEAVVVDLLAAVDAALNISIFIWRRACLDIIIL